MSERFTVQLDSDNSEWVETQARTRDRSKAWIINESLRAVRGENSLFVNTGEVNTGEVSTADKDRLDEIEDRLDKLEQRIESSPKSHERDARSGPGQAAHGSVTDEPSGMEEQKQSDAAHSGSETPGFRDVLSEWVPSDEVNAERAREEATRAAEWLREQGGRHKRSEMTGALAAESPFSDRVWWERAAQPGLRELDDAGLVEYRAGFHDYRWSG